MIGFNCHVYFIIIVIINIIVIIIIIILLLYNYDLKHCTNIINVSINYGLFIIDRQNRTMKSQRFRHFCNYNNLREQKLSHSVRTRELRVRTFLQPSLFK